VKKLFFCAMMALFAQSAFAISPLDRSAFEIRDIVMSPQLRRLLPPTESILDIRQVSGGYLLTTRRYQLYVEVVYGPYGAQEGQEGQATLQFGEPKEL
jgi:hypothetical protein